ncbi:MAG: hypothetical protein Q9190_001768 [Brigantiaea leucoxantha]
MTRQKKSRRPKRNRSKPPKPSPQEKAHLEKVKQETLALWTKLKADGIGTYKFMDTALRGKIGSEFWTAKMVIVSERSKERAAEFKTLFPEYAERFGQTMKAGHLKKLRKEMGLTKEDWKLEMSRRREEMGIREDGEEEDGDGEREGGGVKIEMEVDGKDEEEGGVAIAVKDEEHEAGMGVKVEK